MKKFTFPPSNELLVQNYKKMRIPGGNEDVRQLVSQIPLTHVTTLENVEQILKSGELLSIHEQEKQGKFHDRMRVNTDILDRECGFDKYVFTTLGRTAFHNGGSIAFIFHSEDILGKPGVIASVKEVSDCGALVSNEAKTLYRNTTGKDPGLQNRKALSQFFSGIIRGSDFERFFIWFLGKNFLSYLDYLITMTYPGETLELNELGTMNVWGGPQCMIPNSLNLDTCIHILTRTQQEMDSIIPLVHANGRCIPVSSLEGRIKKEGILRVPPEGVDNFLRGMNLLSHEIMKK